jgi:hypothetical protein
MPNSIAAMAPAAPLHQWWIALPIFIQVVLSMSPASAESPVKVLDEFGLYGTWADDCNADPSPTNPYAIFQLTSRGNVELRHDFGPLYDEMVYRIVEAQRLSYYRLALRQLLTSDDQIALNVVMMKSNDRIRVWSSHGTDGTTFVENGEIPAAKDQETGWMMRCNVKWTRQITPWHSKNANACASKREEFPEREVTCRQRPGASLL